MKGFKKTALGIILACLLTVQTHAGSYIMTYCFAGTPTIYKNNLEKTDGIINTLSPSWFDLNTDGSMTIASITPDFVAHLHSAGMKVTPFLSNHWVKTAGNACLNNIEAITTQLANAVTQYDLDGINVDIQNVDETYRDRYTLFVKRLREKLPEKIITVATAANPKGWTLGWHGSYDYAQLAAYSDYLMIMAYDESYYGSAPGPVASSSFVENSIIYALKYTTPDKIVLGVPFFGRYWKSGASVGGSGITMADVETLLKKHPSAVVRHDTASQSVEVKVTFAEPYTLWGGSVLSAGDYTIWYDNTDTLLYKVDLVNKYKLRGLGSWALGQENPEFWKLCHTALKNLTFDDITGHWAETSITTVYDKGWMTGNGVYFRPDDLTTRAEVTSALVRLCNLKDKIPGADFSDTTGHWAEKEIAIARNYNLVQGYENGSFRPDSYITREEMAVLLDRIIVLSTGIDFSITPFSDLAAEGHEWSYNSIIKLYAANVYTGFPDGTFRPDDNSSRAQIAALLERISGLGISIGEPKTNSSPRQEKPIPPR